MPDPSQSSQSAPPSPARWAASGVIGGASVVGMLWAVLGRAPAPLEFHQARPSTQIAAQVPVQPQSAPVQLPANTRTTAPSATTTTSAEPTPQPDTSQARTESRVELEFARTQPDLEQQQTQGKNAVKNPGAVSIERLNINSATMAELELLPRIGPSLAGRIISFRESNGPIRSLTHLTDVKGIGVRTIEQLEPYVRFD